MEIGDKVGDIVLIEYKDSRKSLWGVAKSPWRIAKKEGNGVCRSPP